MVRHELRRGQGGVAVRVEGGRIVVELRGWRRAFAMQSGVSVPLSDVVSAVPDPFPRGTVGVGPRPPRRREAIGVFRYGTYHGVHGWAFWAIDSGKGSVVVELSAGRYRFLVVEVADPAALAAAIGSAKQALRGTREGGHEAEEGPALPPPRQES
ncbi:MAG: hypothetical protein M0T80_03660 [Actinomycetota bacterium]|nr:hypothetical protein [Actinomycetota bacterium]